MPLPPNDFLKSFIKPNALTQPNPQKEKLEQLLIDARNLLGLSGELLGTYLTKLNSSKEQYQIYSLCCNYFQMENRFNLQLNQMNTESNEYRIK
ncbi:hypothetical protein [Aliikangiella maris]|uniref:Uncharacterized protein n=2 Tax=Aliikangiella maris TaxID=3162458 RepID=A0ABV2BZK2_9GAMM